MEFWDKNITEAEIIEVLKDERNSRFFEFASLFLSRTNDIKMVFSRYLVKKTFCRNWNNIKRKMRKNKWNDSRIVFWDEVYKITKRAFRKDELRVRKGKTPISAEIKAIGDLIRESRERNELTQKELAKRIGISQQSICLIERGLVNVSFVVLQKIAENLDLSISIIDRRKEPFNFQTINTSTSAPLMPEKR